MPRPVARLAFFALAITASVSAQAQQSGKIYRVGFLSPNTPAIVSDSVDALRAGLRDLGYVDGQNLVIEYRYAEGQLSRLPQLAAELVLLNLNVIIAPSSISVMAARNATTQIPIVFSMTGDPIAAGIVSNLSRPGGNITGITQGSADLYGKRLEILKELIPRLSLAAILFNPKILTTHIGVRETQASGRALGIRVEALEATNLEEIDRAFMAATKIKTGAITFVENLPITSYPERIIDLSAKHKLPAIYATTRWSEHGGLASYGRHLPDSYRRLAAYVDKIFKGTNPGEIPVEQWTKLQLVINLKTAKQIGLTIPPNVLARADRVIR
jgi:putative ABC transport system substrate-binding protein